MRLGAIAAATERIAIGSGIANSFTRTPPLLASAALDLDELSDGRFTLGLGSGTQRMNEEWYGLSFSKPAARTRELVALLRAMWKASSGMGFRWDGEFWQLAIQAYSRANAVRDRVPIWVAAVNRGMIRTAGSVADGMVGHPIHSRRWHREVTLPILREAEEQAGRPTGDCELAPYVITSIQRDRELAIRDAKRMIGFSYTVELYHTVLDLHGLREVGAECRSHLRSFDLEKMADAVPDELVEEIAVACTPDEARDRLELWSGLTDRPLLYPASIGTPPERIAANHDNIFECFGDGQEPF